MLIVTAETSCQVGSGAERQSGRALRQEGRGARAGGGLGHSYGLFIMGSRGSPLQAGSQRLARGGETAEEGGGPRGGLGRGCGMTCLGGSQVQGLPECERGTFWLGLKPPTSLAP